MIQFISGITASAVHVLAGPDHLAAVTPLAIESKRKAWAIGVFWGIGHLIGMLLIGGLFILFKDLVNVDLISRYSEQMVGIVLIGLGIWSVIKVFRGSPRKHMHPHFHDEPVPHVHIHEHSHEDEFAHLHTHDKVFRQNKMTALSIGTLHGFAGISHFLLILPTLALPTMSDSILYLGGFGLGTVLAMALYAVLLGWISHRSGKRKSRKVFDILRVLGGLVAIGIGIFWLFSTIG